MKKLLLLVSVLILSLSVSQGAPYGGDGKPVSFKQPNGKKISLRMFGDEFYARTVTLDGYTVVYSGADRTYYYAQTNMLGDELIATQLVVGVDEPAGLEKQIKLTAEARQKKWSEKQKKFDTGLSKRWAEKVKKAQRRREIKRDIQLRKTLELERGLNNLGDDAADDADAAALAAPDAAPVNGSKVGLTILVQFPEDVDNAGNPAVNFPTTQAKIERYCNEFGYNDDGNSGSVRDYFTDQSGGAFDYTMKVTQVVTMPEPRGYYNWSDYPANANLRDSGLAGNMLVRDAIAQLVNDGYDFSGLTVEGGEVVSTNLFFAGNSSGVWSEGLWPHRWGMLILDNPIVSVDGVNVRINDYQITNLSNAAVKLGTFVHESGHLITGFPDLYDTNSGNGSSSGLGRHCLMASGNASNGQRTPSPINIYLKDTVGWANVIDILATEYHDVTFNSSGNNGYRIYKPGSNSEYFIFENRAYDGGNGDIWAQFVPDKGMLIWHIDEAVSGNQNQQMTSAQHYKVSLEQQDGQFDLENNSDTGDSTDAYDINSAEFNDANTPNANWWDGSASGIKVKAKSAADGGSMNVEFGENPLLLVQSPNGGELVDPNGSYEIKWSGEVAGNVSIDLYKAGMLVENLGTALGVNQSFIWYVNNKYYVLGDDYSVKVTSVLDPAKTDDSDGSFSIHEELFPVGSVMPVGWVKPPSANKGWVVASDKAFGGSKVSLSNDDIDDNQTADVEYTGVFEAGMITFQAEASSELGYDALTFYIDDVKQVLTSVSFSGLKSWTLQSIPITAGEHTVRWRYEKDVSASKNDDKVWIDDVFLPLAPVVPVFTNQGRSSANLSTCFSSNEIWDVNYKNSWSGSDSNMSIVADGLKVENPTTGKMLDGTNSTKDGGVTTWSSGNDGDWTVEARIKFDECSNGYALWLGTGTKRIIVEIYDDHTQDYGGESYNVSHSSNEDGQFHVYRVAHDSTNEVYHVFRDGVRITPVAGAVYDATDNDERLLFGDYTSKIFGDDYDVTIDYICYDQTGDYLPIDSDLDGDGIPDYWEYLHFDDFTVGKVDDDADGDGVTTSGEFEVDSDPTTADNGLEAKVEPEANTNNLMVMVPRSSVNRLYTLFESSDMGVNDPWTEVTGAIDIAGNGGDLEFSVIPSLQKKFYRIKVKVP